MTFDGAPKSAGYFLPCKVTGIQGKFSLGYINRFVTKCFGEFALRIVETRGLLANVGCCSLHELTDIDVDL